MRVASGKIDTLLWFDPLTTVYILRHSLDVSAYNLQVSKEA